MTDIYQHPLSSLVKRYERLGVNPRAGNEAKQQLLSEGLVVPKRIATATTQILLFELTVKGKTVLRDLGYQTEQQEQEGITHLLWKTRVADWFRSRGYEVLVEEHVNGKPDVIAMKDTVRAAIEIETGASDVMKNIEKNIKAGFDEIVCVATSKELEEKIKQDIRELGLHEKVRVTSVFEFDLH